MVVPAMFRLNEFNSKMADGGEGKRRRKRDTEPTWLLLALQEMMQSDSGGTKMCLWNIFPKAHRLNSLSQAAEPDFSLMKSELKSGFKLEQ